MWEKTFYSHGFAFRVRKVSTGGYRTCYASGWQRIPLLVYYSVTQGGVRVDSALSFRGALKIIKHRSLALLKQESA